MGTSKYRPTQRQRILFYLISGTLWASGILWLLWPKIFPAADPFAPAGDQGPKAWIVLHGSAAAVFLVFAGWFLQDHLSRNWKRKTLRISGLVSIGVLSFLALTGYGLYYLPANLLREISRTGHWWLGIASPIFLGVHIRNARRLS